jgi:hypothetical protein
VHNCRNSTSLNYYILYACNRTKIVEFYLRRLAAQLNNFEGRFWATTESALFSNRNQIKIWKIIIIEFLQDYLVNQHPLWSLHLWLYKTSMQLVIYWKFFMKRIPFTFGFSVANCSMIDQEIVCASIIQKDDFIRIIVRLHTFKIQVYNFKWFSSLRKVYG